jgi:hypothetical protein
MRNRPAKTDLTRNTLNIFTSLVLFSAVLTTHGAHMYELHVLRKWTLKEQCNTRYSTFCLVAVTGKHRPAQPGSTLHCPEL